jgi:U3 small nucleolar RNA-associated protein 21
LNRRLRSHRDFEAVQTFLNVFLRIHGDLLIANAELRDGLEGLLAVQKAESGRVLELLASGMGTLGFVREVL